MRPTRTRPTRQETADRLIDGALGAFAERGFHGARLEDICAKAGLTRGAFYSGFKSKDELFLALYDRVIAQVIDALDRALEITADAQAEPFTAFSDAFATLFQRPPFGERWYLLTAEARLYAIRHPSAAYALNKGRTEMRRVIAERLVQLIDRHGRVLVGDANLLARALIVLADGALSEQLVEPDTNTAPHLIRELLPSILLANTALKGA